MRDGAFDAELETPFAKNTAKVGTAGGLQTWHLGLMGAIVVGVIVAILLVCSLCKKCPLHKKLCSKDKEPVVKPTEPTKAGEKPTQLEEKEANEMQCEKIAGMDHVSVTVSSKKEALSRQKSASVSKKSEANTSFTRSDVPLNPDNVKQRDDGFDDLDPNDGQDRQIKSSQKQKETKEASLITSKDGKEPTTAQPVVLKQRDDGFDDLDPNEVQDGKYVLEAVQPEVREEAVLGNHEELESMKQSVGKIPEKAKPEKEKGSKTVKKPVVVGAKKAPVLGKK